MSLSNLIEEPRNEDDDLKDLSHNNLLVIILDTNPSQKIIRDNPNTLTLCVESIIALGNAHLLQRPNNRLAVLSCHHHTSHYLYPLPGKQLDIRDNDGQFETFNLVEQTVKHRLGHIIDNAPIISNVTESLMAGTMSMAMCYISRIQRTFPDERLRSRILVVSGSNENASQYLTFMNVFFTALKLHVVIDVCVLDKAMSIMQKGCDMTGGKYLELSQLDGLIEYLLWVFLPDPEMRKKLVLPPQQKVDYRASCFCHRELINIGYVCSACLSVYCKYSPLCTTCHAVFKLPTAVQHNPKQK